MTNDYLFKLYNNQMGKFDNLLEWKNFLKTSSNNYKCSFAEQVLIYAQKPTATAVLEYKKWKKFFNRYVNSGSKGIAFFDNTDNIKYYFDISDTTATTVSKPVNTWQYRDTLNNTDIETNIFNRVKIAVSNHNLSNEEETFVINSSTYMILNRIEKLDENSFNKYIFTLKNSYNFENLGNIINNISRTVLTEISEKNNFTKDLAKETNKVYNKEKDNDLKRESEDGHGENIAIQTIWGRTSSNTIQRRGLTYKYTRRNTPKIYQGIQKRVLSRVIKHWNVDSTLSGRRQGSGRNDGEISFTVQEELEHNRGTQAERPLEVGGTNAQRVLNSQGNSVQRTDISTDIKATAEEKSSVFSLPMETITEIVCNFSSCFEDGKYEFFQQFEKNEKSLQNEIFLKSFCGVGGRTTLIDGYGEWHDQHGLEIKNTTTGEKTLISWKKFAKYAKELIKNDRYFNNKEKAYYPIFLQKQYDQSRLNEIGRDIEKLHDEYIEYSRNIGNEINFTSNRLINSSITNFKMSKNINYDVHNAGDYVIPTLTNFLQSINDSKILLSDKAEELLNTLREDKIVLKTFETKHEPDYEYVYSLGDTVYIGADTYEINSIDDTSVLLRNANFPLFTETMELGKFHIRLLENNQNDHLRTIVEKSEDLRITENLSQEEKIEPKTICETYAEYKSKYVNDIVFYQIGDFFEILGADAEQVSNLCDIQLTSRLDTTANEKIKMVGIPKSHINNYTSILGENGYTSILVLNEDDNTEINIIKPQEKIVSVNETSSDTPTIDLKPAYINYLDTQKDYPDRVILQRNGNFYEAFNTNALIIYNEIYVTIKDDAPTLELKIRNMGLNQDNNVDMVGIPTHLIDIYLDKLRNYGCSLTIIDPLESEISLHHLDYKPIIENEKTKYFLNVNETDDIIDYVLLSKDIDKYTETAQSAIYNVFTTSTSDKEKLDAVKGYYGNLDTTYITEHGDYMEVLKSNSFGLDFIRDEQLFSISYENMVSRISKYISSNIYPHSSIEQSMPYSVEATSDAFDAPFTIINENCNIDDNYVRDEKGDILLFDTFPQALDVADKLNKEYLHNLEIAEEPTSNTQDTSKELFVGDIFEYNNKQWKVKKNDGFMLTADNTDKDDINSSLSWIGSIERHNYTIIERNNANISVIEDNNELEIAENTAPKIQFFVDLKDIEKEIDYSLYNDGDIIGYNIEGVEYKVGKLENTVYTTSKACITPYGTVLGADMSPEIYAEYKLWKDSLTPLTIENEATEPVAHEIQIDVKDIDRVQYQITDNNLGVGTPTQKITANINAIKTLKLIESENRLATSEEQEILSKYVGFGGLANCFDENNNNYITLKNLLSDEEYAAARASTLTAFYTSPTIINSMYNVLSNIGFNKGNVLEPACGVGNFIGMLPDKMSESKVYGVELDSISGRIATQLYQKSNIAVSGYEDTNLPNDFFDIAIGNVPFGQFKVSDTPYNKHNWLIHDYFFGKTLDKVRTGGVVAFISSKGTLDKANSNVRRYLAQKADLIGAIRLPNNAFKANAGTEVTSDIIFLQKHDRNITEEPNWVHLGQDENGLTMNQYFIDNPHMILGEMKEISGQFGLETACVALDDESLEIKLSNAIKHISTNYQEIEHDEDFTAEDKFILADPSVRNFSYTLVEDDIYYRQNGIMKLEKVNETATKRIKGMISIRDSVRKLISYQAENYSDEAVENQQRELNRLYDTYTKKYGVLSSRGNQIAFSKDDSYAILTSLEHLDDDGNLKNKADIFSKRTIRPYNKVENVDTSSEALAVTLGEKGKVDLEYMSKLTNKTTDKIEKDLQTVIYRNINCPEHKDYISETHKDLSKYEYVTADEYLSGNVRRKLRMVNALIQANPDLSESLDIYQSALEKVQPVDLMASEIAINLGTPWIPTNHIDDFMHNLFSTSNGYKEYVKSSYSNYTGEWNISNKNYDYGVKSTKTFGTDRMNGYKILEHTLNNRDIVIYDYETVNEKRKAIVNQKETQLAQSKQKIIQFEFSNWIYADPTRRQELTSIYNETFNSTKPRVYDGKHLIFEGMNTEIELREHQKNAIARSLYGGNSLFAHVVGAGKTFAMVASAMESKRLNLCNKSMFVVPNHLTGQWASDFMELYPTANILVTTKKDFETKNRKKFLARIATGDYDAVILGHSQFEKIPMSIPKQIEFLENEKNDIIKGIESLDNSENRLTVKQLEKVKMNIENKLEKLNNQDKKDNIIDFEELGVDRIYVDEAHNYKNLYAHTKMRNVSGIAQTEAQKSSDMYMKCKYLNELTDNKGVIFATGTPVSNTMVELFTMQRYLQPDLLKSFGLNHFDAWASNYGEKVTSSELAPEGTGLQIKTRFAKFNNLPELINMFKEVADVQTADMLNLPTPKVNFHTVTTEASELQKEMISALADRAKAVRDGIVKSYEDNMLLITGDGRKLALDQRLINNNLEDYENSKVNICANNIYKIWNETTDSKGTQLVFSDLSTPKFDGTFNVYEDLREKLVKMGIPKEEIKFIHEANNDKQKEELFKKVRNGAVRVLIGNTAKCGAGTNVQNKLVALHDLDVPWRPSDLAQRLGRIERQGNENKEVDVYRYITKGTFDAYSYQLIEKKQRFISQVMTSKTPLRSIEDVDDIALSYAEIKMCATENPLIQEKMSLDVDVSKLKLLKQYHLSEKYTLEDAITTEYPRKIAYLTERIEGLKQDKLTADLNSSKGEEKFSRIIIDDVEYLDKQEGGNALIERCRKIRNSTSIHVGKYKDFDLYAQFDGLLKGFTLTLKGAASHKIELSSNPYGNFTKMDNKLNGIENSINDCTINLENEYAQLEIAKHDVNKEFPFEDEFNEKSKRLAEIDILLTSGIETDTLTNTTSENNLFFCDNDNEFITWIYKDDKDNTIVKNITEYYRFEKILEENETLEDIFNSFEDNSEQYIAYKGDNIYTDIETKFISGTHNFSGLNSNTISNIGKEIRNYKQSLSYDKTQEVEI